MKQNMGTTDRIVRSALAALLTLGGWMAGFGTVGGVILLVLAVVMLVTSVVAFCPAYAPFGFSTKPKPSAG